MQIIVISGKARHGKDTVAGIMKDVFEGWGKRVLVVHYGDLLKFICNIFSVEELYKLIHDEPVFDNKSQTLYMSQDCYENGNYDNELYMGIDLAN